MRSIIVIAALAVVLAFTGCGGGGGGSSSSGGSSMGTLVLPDGTISAGKTTAITPGSPATFHITITGLIVTQVHAWIGAGFDPAVTGTLATANGDGTFDVTLAVPSPLAAGSLLCVRVDLTDGTARESGPNYFTLN